MSARYRELFRIDCLHGYYADRRCPALKLSPTAVCSRMLDRYRCLFRADAGGGAVFCAEENGQSMMETFDEAAPFSFALTCAGSGLEAFTEMPPGQTAAPDESIYCFSNAAEYTATIDGAERLLLHPPVNALGGLLPVRTQQLLYKLPKPLRDPNLQLFDAYQREVPKDKASRDYSSGFWETGSVTLTQSGETAAIALNLSRLYAGRYQLKTNGENSYDFYLGDPATARHWGVVDIFAGGSALAQTLPALCQVIPLNGIFCAGQSFTISMEARASIWRYYIVSQSSKDRNYDGYQIVAGPPRGGKAAAGPSIGFDPKPQQQVGGRDAWVFESHAPIALFQIPGDRYEFLLRPAGRTSGGVALPYARVDHTRLEYGSDGAPRMCSEIYVYL